MEEKGINDEKERQITRKMLDLDTACDELRKIVEKLDEKTGCIRVIAEDQDSPEEKDTGLCPLSEHLRAVIVKINRSMSKVEKIYNELEIN